MARASHLILYRNNIWPWDIWWMTLCWPRSKVKVTVHTASTWVVDALQSLNLTEFQYNCTHICVSHEGLEGDRNWVTLTYIQCHRSWFSKMAENLFFESIPCRLFYCAKMCAVSISWSIKIILQKLGHSDLFVGQNTFITGLILKCFPFQDG